MHETTQAVYRYIIKKTVGPLNMQLEVFNLSQSRGQKKQWKVYGRTSGSKNTQSLHLFSLVSFLFGSYIQNNSSSR